MSLLLTGPALNRIAALSALPSQLYDLSSPTSSPGSLEHPRTRHLQFLVLELFLSPALGGGLKVTCKVTL